MSLPKERRFQTPKSHWSEGHIHRYLWDPLNKVWYLPCRGPYRDPQGRRIISHDNDKTLLPITCKKCLRS